jgi:nucleoside-triphosphatase THEP1
MSKPLIGLLTGPVGVGKTTVAGRVVSLAQALGLDCRGLLTPAMLSHGGQKAGIWGVDVRTGERRVLARTDQDLGGPFVGPYSFAAEELGWAAGVIDRAVGDCDLLVVDEIGRLELWQGVGLVGILPRLAAGEVSRALVLVRDSLLVELQSRLTPAKSLVFAVGKENREGIAPTVLKRLFR